jgi:hypothetical protein
VSDPFPDVEVRYELQVEVFPVGEEVMGFENFIRFTVSHGKSKADSERTDKHHLSLLQILYPKTRLLAHVKR